MNQEERRQRRQKDTKSAVIVCVIVVLILLVLVAGGVFLVGRLLPKGGGQNEGTDGTELPGENVAATEEVTEQPQTEVQTDPVEEQAAQLVSQMTLEDKIAQMFVITPNALTGYASGVTAAGDTQRKLTRAVRWGELCIWQTTSPTRSRRPPCSPICRRLQGSAPDFRYFYVWTKRAAVSRASPAMMPSG